MSARGRTSRRVVVTGMGIASAIGIGEDEVWANLLAGRTGIDEIRAIDTSDHKVKLGAEVDSEALHARLKELRLRPVDRAHDLAMVAGADALRQAGVVGEPPYEPLPIAVIFGTGEGSAESHWNGFSAFFEKGVKGLRPTTVPRCMYNAISSGLSIHFRLEGANYVVVSACTSATNAIGAAFRQVRDGYADAVLCGGSDGFFDPFFYGVWNNLGVLSPDPDPRTACRPFDAARQGTILGEGAAALLLESAEHAARRGATVRGEVRGYGESSDASHRTQPSADGQARAMRAALDDAGITAADLAAISAHGTATHANDVTEAASIREVLGDAVGSVPVVAQKSYFGHTLGASGALETVTALLGLEHGVLPPNPNLETPDPECDVRLVGREAEPLRGDFVMKNSFGFGGGNGVLILARAGAPDRS
ncbi:MAG: beta-ketoacyl-[acyl-carrier-protein] synthase family protein [Acidobacteria bacterium]|nr:MAG: beta-ketoacyl-[acyl-carrier-protein] synthase family protein [Acidobacteriota bacterium]REK03876.1 MAG: beta-ketoacyl-[acyl-carrier-protein] synthase family protein [Acidobacteriota bacterium]